MPADPDPHDTIAQFFVGLAAVTRTIRTRDGLSQAEIARRARVGEKLISAIEHGRANPSVTRLGQLAQGLGLAGIAELASRADEAAERIAATRIRSPA